MPPHEESAGVPPSGLASPPQEHLEALGKSLHHKGPDAEGTQDAGATTNGESGRATEMSPSSGNVPAPFPLGSTSEPLLTVTSGVGDEPSEGHAPGQHKPPSGAAGSGDHGPDRGAADERGEKEKKESVPPKPWLPLTLTMLALFASLGGNVFLGWVAWDSYNRSRGGVDGFAGSKPSMSS
jgi:hypothetical protein